MQPKLFALHGRQIILFCSILNHYVDQAFGLLLPSECPYVQTQTTPGKLIINKKHDGRPRSNVNRIQQHEHIYDCLTPGKEKVRPPKPVRNMKCAKVEYNLNTNHI